MEKKKELYKISYIREGKNNCSYPYVAYTTDVEFWKIANKYNILKINSIKKVE